MELIMSLYGMIPEFIEDAFADTIKLVPFLFVIFLLIEISESYFAKRIGGWIGASKKIGVLIGSILAAVPQCGFSVIASTLYIKKFITRGTLIAVYISTSDEAIPILLSNPERAYLIFPILGIKIILGILAGYLVDFILDNKRTRGAIVQSATARGESKFFEGETNGHGNAGSNLILEPKEEHDEEQLDAGCCRHHIGESQDIKIFDIKFWLHPIVHTLNIFVFIFVMCIILNYLLMQFGVENLGKYMLNNSPLQPIIAAVIGLIPNCAISVLMTVMYIKGTISFGSVIAGLSSGAGLGLLVLIKKNTSFKDTLAIIGILLLVSIVAGEIFQFLF